MTEEPKPQTHSYANIWDERTKKQGKSFMYNSMVDLAASFLRHDMLEILKPINSDALIDTLDDNVQINDDKKKLKFK